MFKHWSESLATMLAANKIINIENHDAYSYGLELFLIKATLYIIILAIALLTDSLLISLIFTISYMTLRQYTGGYHCKTAEICTVVSIFIYLLMLILSKIEIFSTDIPFLFISALSYIIILIKAPIESANNPLEIKEKKTYRMISIIISTVLFVLIISFNFINLSELSFPVSYALTADAVLIIISLRRKENEKNNS